MTCFEGKKLMCYWKEDDKMMKKKRDEWRWKTLTVSEEKFGL
jgi:hypothetical protein